MSRKTSIAISTGLIGAGVLAWSFAGRPLVENAGLDVPLNPLGINGSPYGEVFAMAMQGPIDTEFNGFWVGGAPMKKEMENTEQKPADGFRLSVLLAAMEKATETRTNPKAATGAHKLYLRRQVEDKLRFAYNLDPSHYANYNSLHFFLTQPQLGTRPELTPSAAKLAEETIHYCLKREDDPRPALTAAAAASNVIELMFNDQQGAEPRFNTTHMRQYLDVLDYCIQRYVAKAKEWDENKQWELLSPQRVAECDDRLNFILKFREAAVGAIERFEGNAHPAQASNR